MSQGVNKALREVHGGLCDDRRFTTAHGPAVVKSCKWIVDNHLEDLVTQWVNKATSLDAELLFEAQADICKDVSSKCSTW